MSNLVCRKSMTPCQTPGMCSPHGGCPATEQVSSAWLAQLRSEYVAFGEQNAALKAENNRLRGLLAEKVVSSTMLTGLVPDDGGMTLGFEGGACGMLAQVFGDQFYESKAVNYLELRFDSAKHPELGSLVVTLQRVQGKTPHQLREEAEKGRQAATEAYQTACAVRDRLINEVAAMQSNAPGGIPAGLYAEVAALRDLRNQVKAYIDGYLQDEVEDRDACVSDDQHLSAAMLSNLLQDAFAAHWDSSMSKVPADE